MINENSANMKWTTAVLFLVAGMYFGDLLYVPMPTDMASHFEFYWKTTGYKFTTHLMYIKYLVSGGSTVDFSYIQNGLDLLAKLHTESSVVNGSKVTINDTVINGVRVLLYDCVESRREDRPAVIFLHGGGLTIGSVETYQVPTLEMAELLGGMVLVSVDYRLAPKHPFPAALDDCLAVIRWLLRNSKDFGIDPTRLAVSGDSAGGYLTAAIVQAINDDPTLPNIKLQVLLFPWLQHFDYQTPSYQKNKHIFGTRTWIPNHITGFTFSAYFNGILNDSLVVQMMVNNHTSAAFKKSFLYQKTFNHSLIPESFRDKDFYTPPSSDDFGNDAIWSDLKDVILDTRFSPILRPNMSGLPRAYIVTCGYDPLRDDGIFYYHRLRDDGVPVMWVNYEDAFHGLDWYGPIPSETGLRLRDGAIQFIKEYL